MLLLSRRCCVACCVRVVAVDNAPFRVACSCEAVALYSGLASRFRVMRAAAWAFKVQGGVNGSVTCDGATATWAGLCRVVRVNVAGLPAGWW